MAEGVRLDQLLVATFEQLRETSQDLAFTRSELETTQSRLERELSTANSDIQGLQVREL